MTQAGLPADGSAPLELDKRIDRLCDQFEADWVTGDRPDIDHYLTRLPSGGRPRLFRELLALEQEYLSDRGEFISVDEYLRRFPQFSHVIRELSRLPAELPERDAVSGSESVGPGNSIEAGEGEGTDLGQVYAYQLIEQLGAGGMGKVYKALHTRLKRVVALKVLPADRMRNTEAVARFEREMEAVGKLDHPNIVRASDAGEANGTKFLVMEYLDGTDLAQLVRHFGRLPIADACELVRQVAVGLQHAHEHGLVHRDIKPSNVMLTIDGCVKILDLGLARLQQQPADSDLTASGQVLGTLDYMAPEQFGDCREVDIRADIFSLGATLYELLCGEAPLGDSQHNTPAKKLMALVTRPLPSIRERRSGVPAELASVLDRMLAKHPADRFAAPTEVAAALEPFARGCDLASLARSAIDVVAGETVPYLTTISTVDQQRPQIPADETVSAADSVSESNRSIGMWGRWLWLPVGIAATIGAAFVGSALLTQSAPLLEVATLPQSAGPTNKPFEQITEPTTGQLDAEPNRDEDPVAAEAPDEDQQKPKPALGSADIVDDPKTKPSGTSGPETRDRPPGAATRPGVPAEPEPLMDERLSLRREHFIRLLEQAGAIGRAMDALTPPADLADQEAIVQSQLLELNENWLVGIIDDTLERKANDAAEHLRELEQPSDWQQWDKGIAELTGPALASEGLLAQARAMLDVSSLTQEDVNRWQQCVEILHQRCAELRSNSIVAARRQFTELMQIDNVAAISDAEATLESLHRWLANTSTPAAAEDSQDAEINELKHKLQMLHTLTQARRQAEADNSAQQWRKFTEQLHQHHEWLAQYPLYTKGWLPQLAQVLDEHCRESSQTDASDASAEWRSTLKRSLETVLVALPEDQRRRLDELLPKPVVAPPAVPVIPVAATLTWTMSPYEVTNQEYWEFVNSPEYELTDLWHAGHEPLRPSPDDPMLLVDQYTDSSGQRGPRSWRDGCYPIGQDDYPVAGVSWYEAKAYCRWCDKHRATPCRLPKVKEWLDAAGLTQHQRFPWGDEFDADLVNLARLDAEHKLMPVAELAEGRSPSGCHHMLGNVAEWTDPDEVNGQEMLCGGAADTPPRKTTDGQYDDIESYQQTMSRQRRYDVFGFRVMTRK